MRMRCDSHFYNTTCTQYCQPHDDIYGHYDCSPQGSKLCHQGWTGDTCRLPICKRGCHADNGYCTQPNQCLCKKGWQGDLCDRCIRRPGCRHGDCKGAPFACHCYPGWAGSLCDREINVCARDQGLCRNGGICRNLNDAQLLYNCTCQLGYRGRNCEIPVNLCRVSDPCKNHGKCISTGDGPEGYQCICQPGWNGKHCEIDIDDCARSPCQEGEVCRNLPGHHFACYCPPSYNGGHCQWRDNCMNSPCQNAMRCWDSNEGFPICQCKPGWEGRFCDLNINDCKGKCQNGGACKDLVNGYICLCPPGFAGFNCEVDIDECASQPCLNGGICRQGINNYTCECPPQFAGQKCQFERSICDPNPCQDVSTCHVTDPVSNEFYCRCPPNRTGKYCQQIKPSNFCIDGYEFVKGMCLPKYNPCQSVSESSPLIDGVCGPGGRCQPDPQTAAGFRCVCQAGYRGERCEVNVDDCRAHACLNGGTCLDKVNSFVCMCASGYQGDRCQIKINECSPNPCLNGGQCIDQEDDFVCVCPQGLSGRWCQSREPPCTHFTCFNDGLCTEVSAAPGGFRCRCTRGWRGSVCQIRTRAHEPCSRVSCQNGGTCINTGDNFNCICPAGYEGEFCERNTDECASSPCLNGGKCVDRVNTFKCFCQPGYLGVRCQIKINECASSPCTFGATCIDTVPGFQCLCPPGRTGTLCDDVIIKTEQSEKSFCRDDGRVYAAGQEWVKNCERCRCSAGEIVCLKDQCRPRSCLDVKGSEDHAACPHGQFCITVLPHPLKCLVPPCFPQGLCINLTNPDQSLWQYGESPYGPCTSVNHKRVLLPTEPTPRHHEASYVGAVCSRVLIRLSSVLLPIGLTVDDFCHSIKRLSIMKTFMEKWDQLFLMCTIPPQQHQYQGEISVMITMSTPRRKSTKFQLSKSNSGSIYLVTMATDALLDGIKSRSTAADGSSSVLTKNDSLLNAIQTAHLLNESNNGPKHELFVIPIAVLIVAIILILSVIVALRFRLHSTIFKQRQSFWQYRGGPSSIDDEDEPIRFNNKCHATSAHVLRNNLYSEVAEPPSVVVNNKPLNTSSMCDGDSATESLLPQEHSKCSLNTKNGGCNVLTNIYESGRCFGECKLSWKHKEVIPSAAVCCPMVERQMSTEVVRRKCCSCQQTSRRSRSFSIDEAAAASAALVRSKETPTMKSHRCLTKRQLSAGAGKRPLSVSFLLSSGEIGHHSSCCSLSSSGGENSEYDLGNETVV